MLFVRIHRKHASVINESTRAISPHETFGADITSAGGPSEETLSLSFTIDATISESTLSFCVRTFQRRTPKGTIYAADVRTKQKPFKKVLIADTQNLKFHFTYQEVFLVSRT